VPIDPITPDVRQVCSKRAFDGQVKKWRRMLHAYDPPAAPAPQNPPPPAKRRADAGAEGGKLRADAGAEGGKRPRLGPQPADAAARAGKAATAAAGRRPTPRRLRLRRMRWTRLQRCSAPSMTPGMRRMWACR